MCLPSPKAAVAAPPPTPIVTKEPDLQISAKKKRDSSKGSSSTTGLNRFLLIPDSSGSGANVPQ